MGKDHKHFNSKTKKNLVVAIILNIAITVAQAVGAVLSGSLSLMSDALHNFSDVFALVVSWVALKLSQKEPTQYRSFGYKRAETLAALINAVSLIAIAIFLIIEGVNRLKEPLAVDSNYLIALGFASIIFNAFSVIIISNDAKDNLNMKSAYLHLFSDMLTSVAVVVGGFCMKYFSVTWIDGLLSILIAIYLVISSSKLLFDTLKVLMQFAPNDLDIEELSSEINGIMSVKNIHQVYIWQLTDQDNYLQAHVELEKDLKLSETQIVLDQIKEVLSKKFLITNTNIQFEKRNIA